MKLSSTGSITMATKPAAKPLLYKFKPEYTTPKFVTKLACKKPANIPAKKPNCPAIGAKAPQKSAASCKAGVVGVKIFMVADRKTPKSTGK